MPGLFDDLPAAGEQPKAPSAPSLFGDLPDAKDTSPGVSDYLKVGGESLLRAVPATLASGVSAVQGVSGVEAPGQEDIFEKGIRRVEQGQREFEQRVADQFPESTGIRTLSRAGGQLGYSLSTALPGIAAGVAAAPTAPVTAGVGPYAAAAGAIGAAAYRTSSAQIMRSYIDTLDEEKRKTSGQGLTPEETEAAKADFSAKATEYGLWEAIPEAVGGAVAGRLIFGPLRKMVGEQVSRSMLGKLGAAAGTLGEELATETATQIGQSQTLAGTKLGDEKPLAFTPEGMLEAAKQVAPDVVLLTALLGGGMTAGGAIYRARKETRLARELQVDIDELRARVMTLLEQKAEYPDISLNVNDPQVRQYLAGAVTLSGGKFVPKKDTTVPDSGTVEDEPTISEQPLDLAPTTPLEETPSAPLTAPAVVPETEPVAASPAVPAPAVTPPVATETQDAAQTGEVGQDVQQQRLGDVQGPAQEGGVETPGAETGRRRGVRRSVQSTEEGIVSSPAVVPSVESASQVEPGLPEEPKLAPTPVDEIPGVAPLKRGYKRTVFTLDVPSFKGDTFIEDISTKGKKTYTAIRRTGQVITPSKTLIETIERHRAAGLERPSEMKFSRTDIDTLSQGIANYLGKPVAPESYKLSAPPLNQQPIFDSLEQILGKRIVFFEMADTAPMRFNGVSRLNPGVLYINAKAAKPLQSIVGHEFLHELKMTDPGLYTGFKDTVLSVIPEETKQKAIEFLREARKKEGQAEYDIEAVNEELVADFFGEQFTTKEFWAKVERRNPQGFARLVERFLAFVEKIKAALQGEQAVALNKAQDAAADALARYIRKEPVRVSELSPKFAAAWHGSPKRGIKAFDKAFIGTGEGAQAFGYGHYFTAKKEIAEWYRNKLANVKTTLFVDNIPYNNSQQMFSEADKVDRLIYDAYNNAGAGYRNKANVLKELKSRAKGAFKEWKPVFKQAIDKLQSDAVRIEAEKGGLYRVELAPAEDEYLRWDLPLIEQSEKVRGALFAEYGIAEGDNTEYAVESLAHSGETIYHNYVDSEGSDKAASEYLHSLGIRGIKYPAESLTANKQGTGEDFNYVVFDDADIQIIEAFSREGDTNGRNATTFSRRPAPSANARKTFEAPEAGDYGRSLGARGNAFRDSGHSVAETQAALIEEIRALEEQTGEAIMPLLNQVVFRNHASFEAFLDDYAAWADENRDNLSFFDDMRGLAEVYREVRKRSAAKGRDLTPAEVGAVEKQTAKTFNETRDELEAKAKQERELAKLVDEDGEPTFSRSEYPLYSKLERVVQEKAGGKIGALQLRNMLKNNGVSPAEIDQVLAGLDEQKVFTKQELLDHIKANTTEFDDVVLGATTEEGWSDWSEPDEFGDSYIFAKNGAKVVRDSGGNYTAYDESGDEVGDGFIDEVKAKEVALGVAAPTQFGTYTLPGAVEGSYREMFVTAPGIGARAEEANKIIKELGYEGLTKVEIPVWKDGHSQYDQVENPIVRIRYNARRVGSGFVMVKGDATILAENYGEAKQLRKDGWVERGGEEGQRILFVEEMQGPSDANQQKMPEWLRKRIYDIGVKRVIALAKEQGFDGIAWTTGEQQAERYDLSKQVDEVGWKKYPDGTYTLSVEDKEAVISEVASRIPEDKLADYVGKELANRIIEGDGYWQTSESGTRMGNFRGVDLKVGGEGLKNLYDTMLPRLFAKYGKEKVGVEEIPQAGKQPFLPITQETPSEFAKFARYDASLKQNLSVLMGTAKQAKNGRTMEIATAPAWLKVMPLSGVVDIYKDRLPQLRPTKDTIDEQIASRNQHLDTGEINRRNVVKAFGRRGVELFNNTVALNSLYQMDPTREWFAQDWVPEKLRGAASAAAQKAGQAAWRAAGMDKATGIEHFKTAYQTGKDAFEKMLAGDTEGERSDAYLGIVAHYKRLRQREYDAMVKKIDEVYGDNKELHAEMMQRLDQAFKNLKGNYTSLYRRGDYWIGYLTAEGQKGFEQLPSKFAADLRVAQLEAEGATGIRRSVGEKMPLGMAFIPQPLMEQLRSAAEKKYIDAAMVGVNKENPQDVAAARAKGIAAAAETVQDMNELFFRWLPETSAMKSSIRRKGTKGFSDDHLLAYMNYVQVHANNIAYLEYGRKIEDLIDQMAKGIRERRDQGQNVELDGHILNDLRARVQSFKSAKTGPVTAQLGKLTSVWYMSSPSTGLVQMSQLGVFTLPYLATRYGLTNASSTLTQALGWAFSPKYGQDNMMAETTLSFDDLHAVVTSENQKEPWAKGKQLGEAKYTKAELNERIRKLSPEQLRLLALREALARNVMNISLSYEATEASRGEDPESLTNKVAHVLMTPMRASELASRKAAILAAFELELAKQKEFDFFGAMDAATEAARETMFDYSKENKGVLLQGSAASVLARFQTFRIMSTFRLFRLGYKAIAAQNLTTEEKSIARRELIGVLGMSAVLAGVMGTPFAAFFGVAELAHALFGDDDEPWDPRLEFDKWLKQNYGETAAAGVQRGAFALMNLDVHRRIGMDFFNMGALDAPAGTRGGDYFDFVAAQLAGPTYSMSRGFFQGWKDIDEGHTLRGLEQMVPKGVKDVLKSYRVATEGLENRAGKKLLADDKIGADEIAMLTFGFSPDEVNQASERERKLSQMSTQVTLRRSELVRDLVQAHEAEDADAERAAREAIAVFNRSMKPFAIRGQDLREAYRKQRRGEKGLDTRRERQIREKFGI